ncbi:hypothetical protein REPUB_Repub02eG0193200 [Reevesia pubescens]
MSFSCYHVDVEVLEKASNSKWCFIGFYGDPETQLRYRGCDMLYTLGGNCSLPWLCASDFNEILFQKENFGKLPRLERQMEMFGETINECVTPQTQRSRSWEHHTLME